MRKPWHELVISPTWCKQIACVPAECVLLLVPLILRENNNIVPITVKYSIPGCGTWLICWYRVTDGEIGANGLSIDLGGSHNGISVTSWVKQIRLSAAPPFTRSAGSSRTTRVVWTSGDQIVKQCYLKRRLWSSHSGPEESLKTEGGRGKDWQTQRSQARWLHAHCSSLLRGTTRISRNHGFCYETSFRW